MRMREELEDELRSLREQVEMRVAKQARNLTKLHSELKRISQENADLRRASNTAVDYTPKKASIESGSGEKPPRKSMMERLGQGLNSKVQ